MLLESWFHQTTKTVFRIFLPWSALSDSFSVSQFLWEKSGIWVISSNDYYTLKVVILPSRARSYVPRIPQHTLQEVPNIAGNRLSKFSNCFIMALGPNLNSEIYTFWELVDSLFARYFLIGIKSLHSVFLAPWLFTCKLCQQLWLNIYAGVYNFSSFFFQLWPTG